LAAVALRLIFPHFSRAIGDRVAAFFDYRSAIAVLGEGISGKRAFIDALGDAWSVAFHPGSGAAPVFGGEDASPPPNATQDPSPNPSNDANPAADFSDAVTAGSFDDAQWGDIPGGTLIL
jgi:hypothetical protein